MLNNHKIQEYHNNGFTICNEFLDKTYVNEILNEAKTLGYAEKNPKSDLNGEDVASKIKILSALCFKSLISENKITVSAEVVAFRVYDSGKETKKIFAI